METCIVEEDIMLFHILLQELARFQGRLWIELPAQNPGVFWSNLDGRGSRHS
jgi:hypothetical protein